MKGKIYTLDKTIELILQNKLLVIAADDCLLKQLPEGNWIGGSNPFMIDHSGGKYTTEHLLVKDFTDIATDFKFASFDETNIGDITKNNYANGFIITIIPTFCKVHYEFALHAPTFENQYINPLIGWISGGLPDSTAPGDATAYVRNNRFTDRAATLYIELPDDKAARIEIINPIENNPESDILTFNEDGFDNTTVKVNGKEQNFYNYLESINYPKTHPIAANYAGAKINVGFFWDDEHRKIIFFAPVHKGIEYKTIKLTNDYQKAFSDALSNDMNKDRIYEVSCLYNYYNYQLEGKVLPDTSANFTWGEIAYHLLNMSHMYMVLDQKQAS